MTEHDGGGKYPAGVEEGGVRPDQLGSTPSLSSLPALSDLGLFQLLVLMPHRKAR